MEPFIILPATKDERNWAATLLSGNEPWVTLGITAEKSRETLNDPEYLVYVAHQQQTACGVIIIDPLGVAGSPYIKSIAVAEAFRSKGVGAALLEFTEASFRAKSRYLFLCVSSFNTRARSFYERLGYTFIGEFKDYVIDGVSEILMSKRLT
jgi:ribosomal protein S18 acetylase RimI-like enzyme